ncbi:hypothetical protein E2C01_046110 [Portunus trituberculatus]|uniref:Uncharacterized protein n=1 Tax=Portunus trituberculatus TaxID=210409 RepID=A0A5B7G3S4_PORTR|nr:hypothetical protein [Portunus trituberculatus]
MEQEAGMKQEPLSFVIHCGAECDCELRADCMGCRNLSVKLHLHITNTFRTAAPETLPARN